MADKWLWQAIQWKYNVDASSSWLKRFYFRWIFLNFNRFSYWAFDLLPPDRRDNEGRLWWTEWQGAFAEEWKAEQEAAKHPFGHVIKIPFDSSLPAETVVTEQRSPNSPPRVQKHYRRNGTPTMEVPRLDLAKLASKVAQSDRIVEHFTKGT